MATKQRTDTPVKLNIKGVDMPANWAQQAGVGEDEQVEIIIRLDRKAAAKRMLESARRMRRQAKQTGLTQEKLNAIVNDD